jgi:SAM-dependent methyltransferase
LRQQDWARTPAVRRALERAAKARVRAWSPLLRHVKLESLPTEVAIQLSYEVLLGRQADEEGLGTYVAKVMSGSFTRAEVIQWIKGSSEYESRRQFSGRSSLTPSLNASRCRFVRALPRAADIVDLGGLSVGDRRGALVGAGYPYPFETLTIVDLPAEARDELYGAAEQPAPLELGSGTVTYRYHSMTDLSGIADASVDLVYSGQSIEHVSAEDGGRVLAESWRVLRPGGHLGLDTPNRRVTRLASDAFSSPDHQVEYTWPELQAMLDVAGFEANWVKGLNYAGESLRSGRFDLDEVAGNCGLYDEVEDCWAIAVVARKPGPC